MDAAVVTVTFRLGFDGLVADGCLKVGRPKGFLTFADFCNGRFLLIDLELGLDGLGRKVVVVVVAGVVAETGMFGFQGPIQSSYRLRA